MDYGKFNGDSKEEVRKKKVIVDVNIGNLQSH